MAFGEQTRQEKLLEELVGKLADRASQQGLSTEQLEALLTRVGTNSAQAMRASLKPENPDHPNISAFTHPEGEVKRPKPKLRVKTLFCGVEEHAERLTPAEIEAYNAITEKQKARGGTWTATIINKGEDNEELHVNVPCETVDQRMDIPSLELLLSELNGGTSVADLHSLVRKVQQLEQELMVAKAVGTVQSLEATL